MHEDDQHDQHDAIRAARMRAGAALRDLGHAFVGRHMSLEQLERLSTAVKTIADDLLPGAVRSREHGDLEFTGVPMPEGKLEPDFSDRPISGSASPWGLDPAISREGEEIVAHVTLRSGHEGAPARSHGGVVAALFDDLMGFVLGIVQEPAFTGDLTVRYEAPTPLHRPLECRARAVGRDGRKLYITAELTDIGTDQVVARAKATFITIDSFGHEHTAERPAPPA